MLFHSLAIDAHNFYFDPGVPYLVSMILPPGLFCGCLPDSQGETYNMLPQSHFVLGQMNFLPKGIHQSLHQCFQWTLPSAMLGTGIMLVLPPDPGLWADVISRWESITINRLNDTTWHDNKSKLTFVENLLGENEKRMWQQWRTTYPDVYFNV